MISHRTFSYLPAALAIAVTVLSAAPVQAQRSAYKPSSAMDALTSLSTYLGPRSTARIVTMTAEEGRPEPLYWEITLLEPTATSGRRVLRAGGGQVFYDKTPLGLPGNRGLTPVVNIGKLKLDSGRAFKTAEGEAAKNRIAFNHANYDLRATDPDSPPVWIVTLVDELGDTVGKVDVSAGNGAILRSVWDPNKILPPGVKPGQKEGNGPGPQPQGGAPTQPPATTDTGSLEKVGRSIDHSFKKLRKAFD